MAPPRKQSEPGTKTLRDPQTRTARKTFLRSCSLSNRTVHADNPAAEKRRRTVPFCALFRFRLIAEVGRQSLRRLVSTTVYGVKTIATGARDLTNLASGVA